MIKFKKNEKKIIIQDIINLESEIGFKFPNDYTKFMLKHNGGKTKSFETYFGDDEIQLTSFHPIKGNDITVSSSFSVSKEFLPNGFIDIGYVIGGDLCMSLNEKNNGAVFVYYSDGELEFLANSFTEFLEGLKEYPEGYFD